MIQCFRESVEPFENYLVMKVERIDYNVNIVGGNFFVQSVESDPRAFEQREENVTNKQNIYTTVCLFVYLYLKI